MVTGCGAGPLGAREGNALGGEGERGHGGDRVAQEGDGLREEGDLVAALVDLAHGAREGPDVERGVVSVAIPILVIVDSRGVIDRRSRVPKVGAYADGQARGVNSRVAPIQVLPEPAVQPKQGARSRCAGWRARPDRNRGREGGGPPGKATGISSIWLKSQSWRVPSQATESVVRHIRPATVAGLKSR